MHGTPMEGTHLPLCTWFGAIYLTATSSKGMSAMVLCRQLGVNYKTAWFLGQAAEWTKRAARSAKGPVQRRRSAQGPRRHAQRMIVMGVERGGKARAKPGKTHAERTIADFVYRNVERTRSC